MDAFNVHLRNQFMDDFSRLEDDWGIALGSRDYSNILQTDFTTLQRIFDSKNERLESMFDLVNVSASRDGDAISSTFNDGAEGIYPDSELARRVRYINAIETSIMGRIVGMFVADGFCNLFVEGSDGKI
jgi:hypothetical protein